MKTLDEFTQEQNQITESMIYDDMIIQVHSPMT